MIEYKTWGVSAMNQNTAASERSASRGIDIAFIVIGLAVFFGLGALFLRGVIGHLKYLTSDEKHTVTAKFVSVSVSASKGKMNEEGAEQSSYMYDITYEYNLDDQPHTYVRKGRSTYDEKDITLCIYRNGTEDFQVTDMYGMWAAVHWIMLALSAFIGIRLILSGSRSLRNRKKPEENPAHSNHADNTPAHS